jgi:hypothetical protein
MIEEEATPVVLPLPRSTPILERECVMKTKASVFCAVLAILGFSPMSSAWAVDLGAMKQKVETVKGQAENVKKEGGETAQSAKDLKAQDAMKNAGEMKDEGKKLKDAVTGK